VGHSVQILYRSPGTLTAWFAPETVQWVTILAVTPFVVVWLLWQLIGPPFRAWADRNAGMPKKDYRAGSAAKAYAHPAYQKTLMALAYAVLLLSAAGAAVIKLGLYNEDRTSMYVNVARGLPAASVLLAIPALGLLITSIGAAAVGAYNGAAVAEAGFLRVIWCFSGTVGFGFAGMFFGMAGGAVVAVWEALAVLMLIAGLRIRSSYAGGGHTVAEQARMAEHALQRSHAEREATHAEARGEYRGAMPRRYWGRIIGTGLMPPVFFIGSFAVMGLGMERSPLRDPVFLLFEWGAGLLFGSLVWLTTRRRTRDVTWDEQGVRVSWYAGEPKRFAWDDLIALKYTQVDKGRDSAVVTAASGETFAVVSGHEGYEQIVPALEAHIWRRDEG